MAQAFIQEIQPKDTKAGTMYDIIFSNGDKVGAGKFLPKGFAAGDYVNYEVKMNGNFKNLQPGSLSKATPPPGGAPSPGAATSAATSGYAKSGGSSGGGYDKRQEIISKQAALNSSLAFVNILAASEALPFPKTAKQDKKADILEDVVMRYAARFYNIATGETYEVPENDIDPADLGAAEANENWEE